MRMKWIKRIDHYVGLPLCLLVSFAFALWRRIRGRSDESQVPRKVLVIKFFGMGSIGYATLITRNLRREFGNVHITLLTFEENREFVKQTRQFDRILGIEKRRILPFLRDTIRIVVAHLFRSTYDLCIDLEFFSRYATLHTAFSRAPQRIGFDQNLIWRRYIYNVVCVFNTTTHIRNIYAEVARQAGVPHPTTSPVRLEIEDSARQSTIARLKEAGWAGEPLVGVNVNASELALGRRWPLERYCALVEQLTRAGYWVFLTGARAEQEYTQRCYAAGTAQTRRRLGNLAGRLDIAEFAAFINLVDLFISNDSGSMIFAFLQNTPTVTIWGPGDPLMYGDKPPLHTSIYTNYPCSPCMYLPSVDAGYYCDFTFPCIRDIAVDQVCAVVFERLRETSIELPAPYVRPPRQRP